MGSHMMTGNQGSICDISPAGVGTLEVAEKASLAVAWGI